MYLGGVAPAGSGSEHLRSRLDVGETLRAGPVKTIELRASMIVGHGSLSWLIVRDSGGPVAGHGPAAMAEVAHAAGRHR